MNTLDQRERAYENKYCRDLEINFRARARGDKLFGLWAAAELGLSHDEAESFARELVGFGFDHPGDECVTDQISLAFSRKNINMTRAQLEAELHLCRRTAKEQILNE